MAIMFAMEESAPFEPRKPTSPTLGELLRHARLAAELTQAELAELVSASERGISDIERGLIGSPNLATLQKIVNVLRLSEHDAQQIYAARGAQPRQHRPHLPWPVPTPVTRLIDRVDEVAALSRLLAAPDTRLVSLLGPGGIGKSRLALAVAAALDCSFRHHAVFVALEDATDLRAALAMILHALNATVKPWQPPLQEQILAALRRREMLLVLDNVEHLPIGTMIVDILTACSNVRILTTSRQPLLLRGEYRFEVPPLALPLPTWRTKIDDLERAPATALFLQSARCLPVDLPMTEQNRADITTICRLAEGVPLHIEQAASLLTTWPLAEIARQMSDPLTCLRSGPVDLPARHRSLEASVRWSYDLLTADEQWLLRLLAGIDGELTDDLIHLRARITTGGPATPVEVAHRLHALVEKHLIRRDRHEDMTRYTLPSHIRGFARAQTILRRQSTTMWAQG